MDVLFPFALPPAFEGPFRLIPVTRSGRVSLAAASSSSELEPSSDPASLCTIQQQRESVSMPVRAILPSQANSATHLAGRILVILHVKLIFTPAEVLDELPFTTLVFLLQFLLLVTALKLLLALICHHLQVLLLGLLVLALPLVVEDSSPNILVHVQRCVSVCLGLETSQEFLFNGLLQVRSLESFRFSSSLSSIELLLDSDQLGSVQREEGQI